MNNLKLYKTVIPYLVAGSLTFASFSVAGITPFVKDKKENNLDLITKVQDDVSFQEYKKETDMSTGVVEYYSKWKKEKDGYSRTISYYLPNDYSVSALKDIVDNNDNIKPSYITTQKRSSLTDDELDNNRNKVFATIIENNKKEVTTYESDLMNGFTTSASIAMFLLLCLEIKEINEITQRKLRLKK